MLYLTGVIFMDGRSCDPHLANGFGPGQGEQGGEDTLRAIGVMQDGG